ncbi:hypothetical protein [Photobacterium sp. 53610]|uniref:hypothetical protein n=1 Tax=Photobacterium sp. 53610 TaxID=3102789 RepID=UPI002EDA08A7
MNTQRQSNSVAGFLFIASMLALALVPAYTYVGDYVEKGISFVSGIVTVGAIIALASIWRGVKLLKNTELKGIAIALPLLTVLQFVYMIFAYPEQDIFQETIADYLFEFTVYLFISAFIWRATKS